MVVSGRVYAGAGRLPPPTLRPPAADGAQCRAANVRVHPTRRGDAERAPTWDGQHAGLWAALLAAGRAVQVVVGRNAERLIAVGRALDRWVSTPAIVDAHCEDEAARVAEQVRCREQIASVRAAIATLDEAALATYGGLNGAVARCAALAAAATAASRVKPMIATEKKDSSSPCALLQTRSSRLEKKWSCSSSGTSLWPR